MKGIAHFVSGVAAASFCPWAVQAATDGNPLYFILGGACGILPDTLDFKFYRFFFRHDIYVDPDPAKPDPQAIADALAAAISRAHAEHRTIRVKLNTIKLGADHWRQYVLKFDTQQNQVLVRFGPIVNTGQVPIPGTEPAEKAVGRAALACPIVQTYDATTRVDIFDGPTFEFEPDPDGKIVLHFLPWHRKWSHSFTLAGAVAAVGWLLWSWQAAVVILAGFAAHILEDQLGFMGSNLFAPFTKNRMQGLHWMRSGDAMPNFGAVWLACMLIFWNLYRFMPDPRYHLTFLELMLFGVVIPMGLFGLALRLLRRGKVEEEEIDMADEWGDSRMA